MDKEKLGQEPAFSNSETYNPNNMEAKGMIKEAYELSDELLKQENE